MKNFNATSKNWEEFLYEREKPTPMRKTHTNEKNPHQ